MRQESIYQAIAQLKQEGKEAPDKGYRRIRDDLAYVIDDSNNNLLVYDTFHNAVILNPVAKPTFHSDRGFQYTGHAFHEKLLKQGMVQSMSHFFIV